MKPKKTPLAAGLMLAGLALVLAACSGPAAATTQPVAATQAVQPAATAVPAMTTAPAATAASGASTEPAAAPTLEPTAAATTAPSAAAAKINLNTATADDFLTIPNVGSRMVREFMEYRPYASLEQFRREIGKYVPADQVAAYEQYVYVPVDINQADAATLQQLPGVTADIAAGLIAARPYADSAAFLQVLGASVSADELAAAPTYLAAP